MKKSLLVIFIVLFSSVLVYYYARVLIEDMTEVIGENKEIKEIEEETKNYDPTLTDRQTQRLLEYKDLSYFTERQPPERILRIAAAEGNLALVKELLCSGVDINAKAVDELDRFEEESGMEITVFNGLDRKNKIDTDLICKYACQYLRETVGVKAPYDRKE
ncbi:MAG: hypothetical protein ACRCY4_01545 [Brevinema sp.]